jgi:Lon protease-like protein
VLSPETRAPRQRSSRAVETRFIGRQDTRICLAAGTLEGRRTVSHQSLIRLANIPEMPSPPLIPLFPLGLVLVPDELLPLHIFEERYRDLVHDCLEGQRPFGIVLFQDGRLSQVGCTAEIKKVVQRYEDGRLDIVVAGRARFRVGDMDRSRSYLQAQVEPIPDATAEADLPDRERLITQHIKLLELAGRTPSPTVYQDRETLSYFIALNAGLAVDEKQEMLEMPGERERIAFLIAHMARFIPRVEEAETLRRKISNNGHFPDFPPPA